MGVRTQCPDTKANMGQHHKGYSGGIMIKNGLGKALLFGLAGLAAMNHMDKQRESYGGVSEVTGSALAALLAELHSIKSMAWVAHWNASGPDFYGTHLMFQRIYEGMTVLIDDLGERYVAYTKQPVNFAQFVQPAQSFPAGSQDAAKVLLAKIQGAQALSDSARMSLSGATGVSVAGLDDYLMALNNTLDGFSYLLIRYIGTAQ